MQASYVIFVDGSTSPPKALSTARSMSYERTFTSSKEAVGTASTVAGIEKSRGRYNKWGSPSNNFCGVDSPNMQQVEMAPAQPSSDGNSQLKAPSYSYRPRSPSTRLEEGSARSSQVRTSYMNPPPRGSFSNHLQPSGESQLKAPSYSNRPRSPSTFLEEGSTHSQVRIPSVSSPPRRSFHNHPQHSGESQLKAPSQSYRPHTPSTLVEESSTDSKARALYNISPPRGSFHSRPQESRRQSPNSMSRSPRSIPPPRRPPPRRH